MRGNKVPCNFLKVIFMKSSKQRLVDIREFYKYCNLTCHIGSAIIAHGEA